MENVLQWQFFYNILYFTFFSRQKRLIFFIAQILKIRRDNVLLVLLRTF